MISPLVSPLHYHLYHAGADKVYWLTPQASAELETFDGDRDEVSFDLMARRRMRRG